MLVKSRPIALLFAIVAPVGCVDEPGLVGADPDLLGTWSGTEVGGGVSTWTMVFTVTEAQTLVDAVEVYAGTYAVDVDTDPRQLTVLINSSTLAEAVGKTTNAIYERAGDQLTVAANEPGDTSRPTSFTPGGGTHVFELARQ